MLKNVIVSVLDFSASVQEDPRFINSSCLQDIDIRTSLLDLRRKGGCTIQSDNRV